MGKSRAKWIKNIFSTGKKTSKSGLSKEAGEKETFILKGSTEVLEGRSPVLSDGLLHSQNRSEESQELRKGNSADTQKDAALLLSEENLDNNGLSMQSSAEKEKAATKVQATYRGYLARRAFRVLKGIIRLQALVRGHLVRRQAIATLYRMQGIVKLQRMIRGQRDAVKPSRIYIIFRPEKLKKNSFIYKLLISPTSAMPLSFQCDQCEPNSDVMWLQRWSVTQFWAPPLQTKKVLGTGFKKQQNGIHSGETEPSRSKRTRRVPNAENNSSNATSDLEKPNRNQRKTSSYKLDSSQEPPQSEFERVKRSLRKVSASSKEVLESSESIPALTKPVVAEPTTQHPDNSERVLEDSSIAFKKEDIPEKLDVQKMTISEDLAPKADTSLEGLALGETNGLLSDECPKTELNPSMHEENGDDTPAVKEELTSKEESDGKVSHKTKRRMSFPAKQEYPENVSVNTPSPTVPSYMAATESAKAKLRGQGSARFSQEAVENGSIRRHSLPSSNSGRLSSMSPRVQRQVQVNGKGASKTDRALLASRESNEKPEWRR